MGITSKDGEVKNSIIWECLDCCGQWAEARATQCVTCNSFLIAIVCDTRDQFYLLNHPEAIC